MKLFIKNDCPNCHEIMETIIVPEEDIINVDEDFNALAELIEQGIIETPVLKKGTQYYAGLEKIKEYWKIL